MTSERIPGRRQSIVIGSNRQACDVWTSDPRVSPMHCRITQLADHRFMIEDLGSALGTAVTTPVPGGWNRIQVHSPMVIPPGSWVSVAGIRLPWVADR